MAGLKGLSRTPVQEVRTRRDFARLASQADFLSGALAVNGNGVITLTLATNGGLIQTSGLSLNLGTNPGLQLVTNALSILLNPTNPCLTLANGLAVQLKSSGSGLKNDGPGLYVDVGALGVVTSVTASLPLLSSGTSTPNISIPAATNAADGYLTAADHITFAAKADYSFGANNFTGSGTISSGVITCTGLNVNGDGTFTNNNFLYWKDSGGTARRVFGVSTANDCLFGTIDAGWGNQTKFFAKNSYLIIINGGQKAFFDPANVSLGSSPYPPFTGAAISLKGVTICDSALKALSFTINSVSTLTDSSGDVLLTCAANKTIALATVVYDDINIEGLSLRGGATAPALTNVLAAGGLYALTFGGTGATINDVYGGTEILHDWKEGTNIDFHVHWMPTTTDAGNVKWQLEYVWADVNGVLGATTTVSVVQAAGGTAWKHLRADIAAITGTGFHIGSHFLFRLFRDPADAADTYAHDAALLSVGIHYQIDTLGSRQETVK